MREPFNELENGSNINRQWLRFQFWANNIHFKEVVLMAFFRIAIAASFLVLIASFILGLLIFWEDPIKQEEKRTLYTLLDALDKRWEQ